VFAEISRKSTINQGNSNVGINRRDPGDFLITYRLTVKSSPCVRFPYEVLKKRIMCTAVNRGGGLPTAVPCANLFCALITVKLGAGTFFLPPPNHEPRTFKSHIYTLRLICACSVAQALSITTFRFRKDVELTKLFKIVYRVVFRGRTPDFRDCKSRSKIACNFTKTKYFENLKVGSDSP
jgi:hypothetical protein